MRRTVRIALAAAAVLLAGGWLLAQRESPEPAPRGSSADALATPASSGVDLPARVSRGEYLARAGNCMACHTERGGAPWAGGRALATPFGTLYAGNLTPDTRTGLGAWTADDFWRALHQGRSRDGRLLYPAFPYTHYTRVTRSDADDLFAYLHSLPAVPRENTPHDLRWPYSTQAALAIWRALYFRPGVQAHDPARDAQWNRGAYLVQGLGHCAACHSTRNALGGSSVLDLSGGMIPMQAWYAPSLTSQAEAGVAHWSVAQIVQLLRTGASAEGAMLGPMAEVVLHSTQHLSEADLQAMAVFLKALPSEGTPRPVRPTPVAADVLQRGARLYETHCAQCHGKQGEGVDAAYPRLAGNRAVTLPVTANLVQVTIHGAFAPATGGNPRPFGMPPFALTLSDADIAAVLTYIRNAWGNQASGVSELDVALQRSVRY